MNFGLNKQDGWAIYNTVNLVYRIIALVIVALWVPLTSHCYLEEAGFTINQSEQCCSSEVAKTSKGDPCDSGCKIVEKSGAKFQQNQRLAIAPALIAFTILQTPPPSLPSFSTADAWPPKAHHLVQFVANRALPARAPSFVS